MPSLPHQSWTIIKALITLMNSPTSITSLVNKPLSPPHKKRDSTEKGDEQEKEEKGKKEF